MKCYTFKGGVHPPDSKHLTSKMPITEADAGEELVFPVSQHIGAPLTPIVNVGDKVFMGQKIADSDAFISAPVFSSVSGEVIAIEPRLHPNGSKVMSVVIKNDRKDTVDPSIKPKDPDKMSKEELVKTIREAGIVGMGGATFPTHVKLSPPSDKKIEYVIVNGAECEPYLTSDHRAMLEAPADVLDGLTIIMKIFGLSDGYVGIEKNKPDAIEVMNEVAKDFSGTHIMTLKTKYPQGAEKQLIKAITGREVPSGGLPADVGVVVVNIDTASAISRAFRTGMPLIKRIVTVSGSCIKHPKNFSVRLGTMFAELIEQAGELKEPVAKLLIGGPMMGIAQVSIEVPVIKGTSAMLFLNEAEAKIPNETPCIRCGRCVEACPIRLMPNYLNMYAIQYDYDNCEKYNVTDCMECGSCSFICPARRELVQSIRLAKGEVMARIKARSQGK